jgi:hypothetical protein
MKHAPDRRSSLFPRLGLLCLVIALAGCTGATGGGGESWSRSYFASFDRVFEATLDALEASDFYLDTVDKERGRVRAASSARRPDLEAVLFVDVGQDGDRIRVDVMAQGPGADDGYGPGQLSTVVRSFLSELDARLEGRED